MAREAGVVARQCAMLAVMIEEDEEEFEYLSRQHRLVDEIVEI
jgi:hypothetical protein